MNLTYILLLCVVVVVVDSHIQRIVLATEETTVTQQVSHRPIKRQSRLWCVSVFSSLSFWTSSSLDVPAGVTQEEGDTGFLIHLLSAVRALIFLARRIQPFLSLVDREIEF